MSEKHNEIEVYMSRRFEKALNKLINKHLKFVEDEIDKIVDNPKIGTPKKGDLSYLRVHKFKLKSQQVLLGYSWLEDKIEIYLLHFGPHDNFYQKMKGQRKTGLKLMQP